MADEALKKENRCLKCGGEMEEGILPDYIGAFGIMPVISSKCFLKESFKTF